MPSNFKVIFHEGSFRQHLSPHGLLYLSILHRLQLRVVGGADDLIVVSVGRLALARLNPEGVPTLLVRQGKELPRGPLVTIQGSFQDPVCRAW